MLRKCQLEDKIILADRIFNDAMMCADVRPLVAKARLEKGLPVDPAGEYIKSEYQVMDDLKKSVGYWRKYIEE